MRSVLIGLALPFLCGAAHAAETWFGLSPNVPPGTPAQITLDAAVSSTQQSAFDVRIFGYYSEVLTGPDGTSYRTMRIPGLPQFGRTGAPDLPTVRLSLAVVTGAPEVKLTSTTMISSTSLPVWRPYPTALPGQDEPFDPTYDPGPGDTQGSEDQFQLDPSIYGGTMQWPTTPALVSTPVVQHIGGVRGTDCECYPVRWNPSTLVVTIATHIRFQFSHPGSPTVGPALNKGMLPMVQQHFFNSTEVTTFVIEDFNKYQARYLIVTPSQYVDELKPFVQHKKSLGYRVVISQLAGGETFIHILNILATWYTNSLSASEHYCLLVGDVDAIPLAYDIGSDTLTDDYYGSPLDLDLNEEVYVGRLSVDNEADLTHQLDKIIQYEANPVPGDYDDVLLVAHKQGAPNKYQGAHESVRTASYTNHPDFKTHYGSSEFDNALVLSDIEVDAGLVCYRGHGSTNTWSGWNLSEDSFHKNHVIALTNDILPVAWSISCTNHNITANDCIGEAWLEANAGAVASYGATRTTGTTANHELDRRLFKAVYDLGFITHSHAIAYAEREMHCAYPDSINPWAYDLLGDPSMKIRTDPLLPDLKAEVPPWLVKDGLPKTVMVKAKIGSVPLMGALVCLYKSDSSVPEKDDIFTNGYSDQAGMISFQVQPATLGDIHVTVQDGHGNIATAKIVVVDSQGCELALNEGYGAGKAGTSGVPELAAIDLPIIGMNSGIELSNALPGATPYLVLGASAAALPWDGGTLWVTPQFLLPLGAPVAANGKLKLTGAIPADPALCGVSLFHQIFYVDPQATGFYHLAMTNGLKRTFGSL